MVDSNNYAAKLGRQLKYHTNSQPIQAYHPIGYQTTIIGDTYSTAVWTVPADQPRQKVTWMTNNGAGPPASQSLLGGLQQKWNSVPIPTKPDGTTYTAAQMRATGTDEHVIIHSPATDELWEFWHFRDSWPSAYANLAPGYFAAFGGYANNVSQWSGIFPNNWGARACSLSMIGGVMMMKDYENGVFPYALCCAVPVVKQGFIPPATRGDAMATSGVVGGSFADAVPEGLIVRLPPGYEPPAKTHPFTKMMVRAIRDYGLVVTDATASTLNFYIEARRSVNTAYNADGYTSATQPWQGIDFLTARKSLFYDIDWSLLQQVRYP